MTVQSAFTAYVACLDGSEINVFRGDAIAGTLEPAQTVALSGKGLPLAQSPDRRRLYASVFSIHNGVEEDRIESFEVDPSSGCLTPLSSTVVMARMAHIGVDRTGGFLLGASFQSDVVAAYPIGHRGQVQSVPTWTMATPSRAHQFLTDYSNRYVYVPCLGSAMMISLLFDEKTGTCRENSPPGVNLQPGAGCRHVAFHPNRRYVYLLNELDGSLVAYRMDPATGALSEIMRDSILGPDLVGEPWGAQIHVSPDGGRLFASERRGSTLAAWRIDVRSGQISDRHIIKTGRNPRCFDITPNGRFLVLSAMLDDRIELYDIGQPDKAPHKVLELPSGKQPAWVEII